MSISSLWHTWFPCNLLEGNGYIFVHPHWFMKCCSPIPKQSIFSAALQPLPSGVLSFYFRCTIRPTDWSTNHSHCDKQRPDDLQVFQIHLQPSVLVWPHPAANPWSLDTGESWQLFYLLDFGPQECITIPSWVIQMQSTSSSKQHWGSGEGNHAQHQRWVQYVCGILDLT